MAKHKSEKCPYLSAYGAGYIRPDQWVTEKLCSLVAKTSNIELVDGFWTNPEWGSFFRRQVCLAACLLQDFKAEAVAATLRDNNVFWLRSFMGFAKIPKAYGILLSNHNRLLAEDILPDIDLDIVSTTVLPTRLPKRDNLLARLNKIDGQSKRR